MDRRKRVSQRGFRSRNPFSPTVDGELASLRARVAQKREYLAVLELELFNTRAALEEFTGIYNARITPLERRLDELQAQLKQALSARFPDQDKGNGAGTGSPPPRARQEQRHDIPPLADRQPPVTNPETLQQLRALFRQLAKRFHPDLSRDPKEKQRRQHIMSQVNQAYTACDLQALQTLAQRPDVPSASAPQTRQQEIKSLRAELARLDEVIRKLESNIRELDNSHAMRLRLEVTLAHQEGRDLLSDIAAHLAERIQDIEAHLAALKN